MDLAQIGYRQKITATVTATASASICRCFIKDPPSISIFFEYPRISVSHDKNVIYVKPFFNSKDNTIHINTIDDCFAETCGAKFSE